MASGSSAQEEQHHHGREPRAAGTAGYGEGAAPRDCCPGAVWEIPSCPSQHPPSSLLFALPQQGLLVGPPWGSPASLGWRVRPSPRLTPSPSLSWHRRGGPARPGHPLTHPAVPRCCRPFLGSLPTASSPLFTPSQPRWSHHPRGAAGGNGNGVCLSAPSHRRKARARLRPEPRLGPLPVPWHPVGATSSNRVPQPPPPPPPLSPPLFSERGRRGCRYGFTHSGGGMGTGGMPCWRCQGTLVAPGAPRATAARVKRGSSLPAGPDRTAAAEL